METKVLDGQLYLNLIKGGAVNLRANMEIVNDLNVFPIPDGDTGENMCYTVTGGITAAAGLTDISVAKVSDVISNGMVLSARGNSGVILSQFFAGIAGGLQGFDTADTATVGYAFSSGVRRAYDAVINPTEGTILTVAREGVSYACSRIDESSSLESFFADCLTEMHESLQRTPDLLAVLKEAGVVDSGGAGLIYIIDGMHRTLLGEVPDDFSAAETQTVAGHVIDVDKFTEDSILEFGYCTEFLLRLQRCKIDVDAFNLDEFKTKLGTYGDSMVVFQTGTIVKVHIHTKTPGPVLNFGQTYGEFLTMKIENMTLQHNERIVRDTFPGSLAAAQKPKERTPFAVVTVASGEGVKDTLRSLGADCVIDGGQGNNPSSEVFIRAFDAVNADTIFVLPNNSNIIMAARQAGQLYEGSAVRVIESKSIGDGYAVLSMLDYSSGDADAIEEDMKMAMDGVQTGLITTAVRDTTLDEIDIHTGNYIGFCGKTMLASDADKIETARRTLTGMETTDHEVLIAIYGKSVSDQEKAAFRTMAKADFRRLELFEIDGGQDVYDFQLIIE